MFRFVGATAEVRKSNGFDVVRFLCTEPDMDLLLHLYSFEKEALTRGARGDRDYLKGKYSRKFKGLFASPRPVGPPKLGLREAFNPSVEEQVVVQGSHFPLWHCKKKKRIESG